MSLLHHVHFLFMNRNRNTNPCCCLKNQNQSRSCGGFSISGKTSAPARDRVIDFGKYKGKMLGSVPSSYLKWVSNNLRAGDFVEWANLADQVLRDPIYRDRIEWEFAHHVLTGNATTNSSSSSSSLLEEISERFGWDNLDKVGWSQVDFDLLGTSKGGRIPRLVDVNFKDTQPKHYSPVPPSSAAQWGWGRRRMERRERQKKMRLRRAQAETETQEDMTDGRNQNQHSNAIANPFPGRQAFLRSCNQSSNPSTTRNNNIC